MVVEPEFPTKTQKKITALPEVGQHVWAVHGRTPPYMLHSEARRWLPKRRCASERDGKRSDLSLAQRLPRHARQKRKLAAHGGRAQYKRGVFRRELILLATLGLDTLGFYLLPTSPSGTRLGHTTIGPLALHLDYDLELADSSQHRKPAWHSCLLKTHFSMRGRIEYYYFDISECSDQLHFSMHI